MKENDVLLIAVPDKPRGKWPLGRVLEIFCGANGRGSVPKVQV